MAGRKGLKAHTFVADREHKLAPRGFGPGDEVPAEYARLIGDHLWEDGGKSDAADDQGDDEKSGEDKPTRSRRSRQNADDK